MELTNPSYTLERGGRNRPAISIDEWRRICPCQRHAGTGFARPLRKAIESSREVLRSPYAALILAFPIALGTSFPVQEPARSAVAPATAPHAARETSAERTTPPAIAVVDDQLEMFREELPLRLITPDVRRSFLSGTYLPDETLTLDLVRAEFFRSEVPYGAIIYREAKRQGLPPELVAAVVQAESDFRPSLLSNKNAHGLMQLIPSTGELMGARDLLDPADNVRAGARYLRYLHDRFKGDETLILAAYNAGPTAVRQFGGVPPYRETRNYLKRVASARLNYEKRIARRHAALAELVAVAAE